MRKAFQLVLSAGLMVWLTHGILTMGQTGQTGDRKSVVIERAPLRFIKDPNPSFSGVAVDSDHNMLVVTDENLFQILEYGTKENTPAAAKFSEPKRIISGTDTRAEMMCGVYIDPKTREIYVMNNDTQSYIPVFGPDQKGNAAPTRYLAGVRGFGIAADEERNLLYMTNQSGTISVFPKNYTTTTRPIRRIEGDDTLLEDPHGITLDTKNKLIYVSNFGNADLGSADGRGRYGKFEPPSITVYPLDGEGNIKPVRRIQGPKTLMNWPSHIVLHVERQELFVANDADDSVVVFKATDQGDVAPIRVIKGPNTGIKHPPGIALDEKLGEIFVASMGNASVTVFPVNANGNVKPLRTVRGGPIGSVGLNIGNPGAVGYDSKRDQILVPN
jgi:DNA-binding beta-propeller fold protein YncE